MWDVQTYYWDQTKYKYYKIGLWFHSNITYLEYIYLGGDYKMNIQYLTEIVELTHYTIYYS